ncbi:MAG: FeoB-associated Cys-rich membrane protein [Deltaproteobacteria bacterium]|jgi:Na+-translocating ferredoxin:NAD+ oxidoreductase RNF subunit RnfB|nr:FeoB-associated Cys-rich membrane protein [Deltaproteobacteria bacterium]
MWDTIIVALIIAAALVATGRYVYRTLKADATGCGTCGAACPTCCAGNPAESTDTKKGLDIKE